MLKNSDSTYVVEYIPSLRTVERFGKKRALGVKGDTAEHYCVLKCDRPWSIDFCFTSPSGHCVSLLAWMLSAYTWT